ncbi:MAG: redoxin domain-containing protein [Candidatus Thermoplasmatota archaeon]|jgi:peroxiredoxin|nr:redoxin domain-containing protein [Candidatus Thermoplasmatota archaeon]MCL5800846.1 redoxin domain-containing protein [Candidatus Thermoplasmatota archaeon]
MTAEIGKPAPDFSLVGSDLKIRSLKDFAGSKTLILFFPGAFTGVCTKEMCSIRDNISKYNRVKAKVVGISVDSPFSLAQFAKENNLTFELLSDANRTVSKSYGALHENFINISTLTASKRAAFILDSSGIVRYKWISEDPKVEPDYEKLISELGKVS